MKQTVCGVIALLGFIITAGAVENNLLISLVACIISTGSAIIGRLDRVEA